MYGCFYALIGGGFTLLFGVLRRFNLAYGSTIMAGAYAGLIPVYLFNAPVLVLFVTTIVVSVLVGLLVEFCCFRFLRKGHELAPLMTAIGMLIVIDETIVYLTDAVGLKYPAPFGDESLALGPFLIRPDYLAILVVSVVSFSAIFYLLYRTRFGRAMRAVAERPDAAESVGSARPEMAAWLTGKGLVVMVLGGLGSFPGAIVGGLALGVLEFEAVWFLGSSYRDILAFAILFLVLIVRPGGLLGTRTA